jgi:hypothetical protein
VRSLPTAVLVPILVAAVVFLLYFQAQPHWLADPDAQDYAQLGRQLAAGRGPTTFYLPWNGLAYLTRRGETLGGEPPSPWPNIVRFPLTPALIALGFLALGPTDEAVHLPAGLAFVLTAGGVAWVGRRAYGAVAGLVAGLASACLPLLVNYSLTGLTEPTLGLLIVAVPGCLLGGRLVLGGVLFGVMILNRYDTALLVIPILACWLLPRRDWLSATARFAGPAAAVVLPWAVYLTVLAGTPLFNLQPASIAAQASGRSDGLGWYLPEYVSPGGVWLQNPSRAVRIAREELAGTPDHLRKLLGWPWLLAGAAACAAAVTRRVVRRIDLTPPAPLRGANIGRADIISGAERREQAACFPLARAREKGAGGEGFALVIFLLAAVLLRALLASLLGLNLQRHFVPLAPLLLAIVAGEAIWLVRALVSRLTREGGVRRGVLATGQAIVAALLIGPSLWVIAPFLAPPREPPRLPTRAGEVEARPDNLARLAEVVGPGQIVASNAPWSVAWQADRRAVPLPPTVQDTSVLEQRFGVSLDAIYVAGQVAIADAPRSWRSWDELRRSGTPPPGYVLAESFQNGGRLFVKAR